MRRMNDNAHHKEKRKIYKTCPSIPILPPRQKHTNNTTSSFTRVAHAPGGRPICSKVSHGEKLQVRSRKLVIVALPASRNNSSAHHAFGSIGHTSILLENMSSWRRSLTEECWYIESMLAMVRWDEWMIMLITKRNVKHTGPVPVSRYTWIICRVIH